MRICSPLKKPSTPSYCIILAVVSQIFLYFTVSLMVLIPSLLCVRRVLVLGLSHPQECSLFSLGFAFSILHMAFSQCDSVQFCVFNLVLMTSRGVVGMEAIAPAMAPQRQYLMLWSQARTPKWCFSFQLKATISEPNGTFIAQFTGKLRQKATAPSLFMIEAATSPTVTFKFSDRINCMRCFRASAGVMIRSWNMADSAPTNASLPKSSSGRHSSACKAFSQMEKQMAWAGAHPKTTIDDPAQKLASPPALQILAAAWPTEYLRPT